MSLAVERAESACVRNLSCCSLMWLTSPPRFSVSVSVRTFAAEEVDSEVSLFTLGTRYAVYLFVLVSRQYRTYQLKGGNVSSANINKEWDVHF